MRFAHPEEAEKKEGGGGGGGGWIRQHNHQQLNSVNLKSYDLIGQLSQRNPMPVPNGTIPSNLVKVWLSLSLSLPGQNVSSPWTKTSRKLERGRGMRRVGRGRDPRGGGGRNGMKFSCLQASILRLEGYHLILQLSLGGPDAWPSKCDHLL